MDCRKAKRELNRYLDGELPVRDRDHINWHLAECSSCRESLERLRVVGDALGELPEPPDLPAGFAERVIVRAERRLEERPAVVPFWKSFSPAMRIAAAAVLMLGIGLGALMARSLSTGASPPSSLGEADPSEVYGIDYLTEAPGGSLADAYLTLASTGNGGGE